MFELLIFELLILLFELLIFELLILLFEPIAEFVFSFALLLLVVVVVVVVVLVVVELVLSAAGEQAVPKAATLVKAKRANVRLIEYPPASPQSGSVVNEPHRLSSAFWFDQAPTSKQQPQLSVLSFASHFKAHAVLKTRS